MTVGSEFVRLTSGDTVLVEPGEPHMFSESTPAYFHFVFHAPTPAAGGDLPVTREQLGDWPRVSSGPPTRKRAGP